MRLMRRNLKPIWYCLYQGRNPVIGADGYETGDTKIIYSDPVKLMCNISPASGMIHSEFFGRIEDYDLIIVTDQMDCPIDENTVIYLERDPKRKMRLKIQLRTNPFGDLLYNSGTTEKYDYIVKRVARSLNHISYAISKVKVS